MRAAMVWLLTGCGGAGAGACELEYAATYTSAQWCSNFYDEEGGRTGEEICDELQGQWTAGSDCIDLGYEYECSDNTWYASPC